MTQNHPTHCPFSASQPAQKDQIQGFDRRWDLSEHAEFLRPLDVNEDETLESLGRSAWRNSIRCIGRRLWKGLEVIDARDLHQPDEIFDALINHLKKATNGGKIVPVMTVFQKWSPQQPGIRIWNHQLLRYAGYQTGGQILGDPMNVQLTELAISLGWSPPVSPGRFDLLPIIIQSGNELKIYELPQKEVLEVPIRHPKYPKIEAMQLKWHAVPIITDMVFATGSELYPCAPFSGNYLGTEIGARNFADTTRYNLLPEIAQAVDLDTSNPRNLWKDHALIILNEAVLWSFDQLGVKIADHHSVSDEFLKFCEQEQKEGRQVSADWSWIVPPISGSATSVFHRLYDQKPVYPNFLLQVPAWESNQGRQILESKKIRGF